MTEGPTDYAATGRPGDDEELLSSGRPPSPLRRLRGDIAVGIVVLAAGGLLLRALTHGHSTHQVARTPVPTATGSGTVSLTGPPPRGVFTFGPANPDALTSSAPCPHPLTGLGDCVTTHAMPADVVAAVQRVYPGLFVDEVETQFRRPNDARFWSRMIAGHDRRTYLIVVVSQHGPAGQRASESVVGQSTVYVRAQRPPFTIQIEVIGLSHAAASLGRAQILAADPRLVRRG